MSHFAVAVFHHADQDYENLLAPYSEEKLLDDADDANVKWDWYQKGGRFDGFFRNWITGDSSNELKASDIDLSPDPVEYEKALHFWEVVVEGKPPKEGEKIFNMYKPEYYLNQYGTKEEYAKAESSCTPWAFVTAEGDWIENGSMGWFAAHNATRESRDTFAEAFFEYVKNNPDLYVTLLDCHI